MKWLNELVRCNDYVRSSGGSFQVKWSGAVVRKGVHVKGQVS